MAQLDMKYTESDLTTKKCVPCEGKVVPKDEAEIAELLKKVQGWQHKKSEIVRTFTFRNYYETIAFVNAVAWIANHEDHHPQMEIGYKTCCVRYWTHAIGGLSENDFLCAAKVNSLMQTA